LAITARLIVFTRYPEPGKTKTRLIPALGPEGAAHLQRQMTEHTLQQVQSLAAQHFMSVDIRFTGGSLSLMQAWLGKQWRLRPQGEGDLGQRLERAFCVAFAEGATQVIAIGIDCPGVNTSRLAEAFTALNTHDVVLGPAMDGGYYLIGMRQLVSDLFQGIAWSTDVVFQQTADLVDQLNLSMVALEPLADVDYPSDLSIWYHESGVERSQIPGIISVVIPVLNEEHSIGGIVQTLVANPDIQVIVVDGGSGDRTLEVAQSAGATVITAPSGRASQMNAGAEVAYGEILLFLHADTRLPNDFAEHIHQTLTQPGVIAGAFQLRIDGTVRGLRLVEWGVKWRSRLLQLPYGDQGIFLNTSTFKATGGFANLPIMEDFELIRRLRASGKVAIAPASVITSGRRWEKLGVFKTTLINQIVILAYLLGVPINQIAQWYAGKRRPKGRR
jgi:rSAM/selenodomain-associated transferase 2/rSAM/selenodomain-associated transferase 1